jgi:uncharacterized protein (DUF486 family)
VTGEPSRVDVGVSEPLDTRLRSRSRPEFSMPPLSSYLLPIAFLLGSNVFMTTAWYWHLRYKEISLFHVILISWSLAFVEYCLAVPANRYGSYVYSAAQLKTIQEVITLTVFAIFSIIYFKQGITWNQVVGFALIASGAFFVFRGPL